MKQQRLRKQQSSRKKKLSRKQYLHSEKTRLVVTIGCGLLITLIINFFATWCFVRLLSGPQTTKTSYVQTRPLNTTQVVKGHPVGLSIPSLNMNLPVIDGQYNSATGTWTLTLDKAQFVTFTSLPNNHDGDTFIYGHYRPEVFARLHLIQPGATASVITNNHYKFNYTFTNTYTVKPSDSSVFSYHGAPILTIQTCSGLFFQNRQMYQFKFSGYQKV